MNMAHLRGMIGKPIFKIFKYLFLNIFIGKLALRTVLLQNLKIRFSCNKSAKEMSVSVQEKKHKGHQFSML